MTTRWGKSFRDIKYRDAKTGLLADSMKDSVTSIWEDRNVVILQTTP